MGSRLKNEYSLIMFKVGKIRGFFTIGGAAYWSLKCTIGDALVFFHAKGAKA